MHRRLARWRSASPAIGALRQPAWHSAAPMLALAWLLSRSRASPALAPRPFLRLAPLPCARPLRYSKLSGAIPVSSNVALPRLPLSSGPMLGALQGRSTAPALGLYGTRSIQGLGVLSSDAPVIGRFAPRSLRSPVTPVPDCSSSRLLQSSVAPVFGRSGAHIEPLPAMGRPGAQGSQCSTHVAHVHSHMGHICLHTPSLHLRTYILLHCMLFVARRCQA